MKMPCSAASLLALSWALPGQCAVQARCRSAHWPFLCLARHTGLHGTHCMLLPGDRSTAWWECSRDSLVESHLPFLLSSCGSHSLIPIDHVWRVGKKNNLPHGSNNSSVQPSEALSKTENRTTLFCCPKSSAFLNHYLLWLDPALTVQEPVGEGPCAFSTKPDTFR